VIIIEGGDTDICYVHRDTTHDSIEEMFNMMDNNEDVREQPAEHSSDDKEGILM